MQVRASHAASRTDGAQEISRTYGLTFIDANLAQVTVHRDVALSMVDDHGVAIKIVIARRGNNAVTWCEDRRSRARRNVHALVRRTRLVVKETT